MMRSRYLQQLEAVRDNLIQMGETTLTLLDEALPVLADPNSPSFEEAGELEAQTDRQQRLIHDQCLTLITREAPVGCDALLVTGVLEASSDLEQIGDHAFEIVRLARSIGHQPSSSVLARVVQTGGRIRELLSTALACWTPGEHPEAACIRDTGASLRAECEKLCESLSQLVAMAGQERAYFDLILVSKHLERILRHAVCIAEQAAAVAPPKS